MKHSIAINLFTSILVVFKEKNMKNRSSSRSKYIDWKIKGGERNQSETINNQYVEKPGWSDAM